MDDVLIDTSFLDDDDYNDEYDQKQRKRLAKYDIHDSDVKLRLLEPAWFMTTETLNADMSSQRYLSKTVQAQVQHQIEYLYVIEQDLEKCIELLQLLLRFSKPLPTTKKLLYDLMARCLIKLDRPEESIFCLKQLIHLCSQDIETYRMLTDVYLRTGQSQETWDSLSNALSIFGYESSANVASRKCIAICDSLLDRYSLARFSIPFFSIIRQRALQRISCHKCCFDVGQIPAGLLRYLEDDLEIRPDPDEVIMDAQAE